MKSADNRCLTSRVRNRNEERRRVQAGWTGDTRRPGFMKRGDRKKPG